MKRYLEIKTSPVRSACATRGYLPDGSQLITIIVPERSEVSCVLGATGDLDITGTILRPWHEEACI